MKAICLILLLICVGFGKALGQNSVESIRKQREKTLKEIELANKILEETRGKTKQSMQEINVINQKLSKRREYIITLEAEESFVNKDILKCEEDILVLNRDIGKLKTGYDKIIKQLYRSRGKDYLIMYFLASENMNQLYRRFRFAKIYLNYVRILRANMEKHRFELDVRKEELGVLKEEKKTLVSKTRKELAVIKLENDQKKAMLGKLKKQQGDIEKEIREKERVARRLENEMTRIIENERKKAGKGSIRNNLTPMELIISNDFGKNQGKLPWPTQRGIISGKYGEHDHPDFKSVKIRNDGIYISTEKGEAVRAVFKGIVSRVFSIPGENYTVIIRHGNYFTLYHNLMDVKVKTGQSVETKEAIGRVFTDSETKETTLYFQVWRETERNDPELWLAR